MQIKAYIIPKKKTTKKTDSQLGIFILISLSISFF